MFILEIIIINYERGASEWRLHLPILSENQIKWNRQNGFGGWAAPQCGAEFWNETVCCGKLLNIFIRYAPVEPRTHSLQPALILKSFWTLHIVFKLKCDEPNETKKKNVKRTNNKRTWKQYRTEICYYLLARYIPAHSPCVRDCSSTPNIGALTSEMRWNWTQKEEEEKKLNMKQQKIDCERKCRPYGGDVVRAASLFVCFSSILHEAQFKLAAQ